MGASDIKLLVATHKPYWMPSDPIYVPIQVGATFNERVPGYQSDSEGDNIGALNPRYCELTALYWGWKNLNTDFLGLCHYRRYFRGAGDRGVLTTQEARALLDKAPLVLPKRRNYLIESIESHYAHTFDRNHLDAVRETLALVAPQVIPCFEEHMKSCSGHMWNMAIMRRDILDAWCSWLFPVLDDVQGHLEFEGMTAFEARVMGRLSELLLDPWIAVEGIPFVERPVVQLEKEDWLKKGSSFLAAKFLGKKYKVSF